MNQKKKKIVCKNADQNLANIIPISQFKKKDMRERPGKYRPISLASTPGKKIWRRLFWMPLKGT